MSDVDLPVAADGRRSSTAFGRAVVADALRVADPAAADAAERETDWRRGYLRHYRALVALSEDAGDEIAAAGLASVHARMEMPALSGGGDISAETVVGSGTPEHELTLPYRGELLSGDRLLRRLDAWVAAGTIEESCAAAVREVVAHPDWLNLSGLRLVVLGAGSEMGPLAAVLGWGGAVIGVDLPRPELWERLFAVAAKSAGRLVALRADLLSDLPAVARWLTEAEGPLVLGNYVYAPGAAYVRLSAAVDALTSVRDYAGLAGLATPTDVFAVPAEAVAESRARWRRRSGRAKAARLVSAGRLLRPNYPDGAPPINDSLVPQQGPNYALAKRIQRWRATVAWREGATVSFSVAPPTRTKSVTGNRLLAAAYAGAYLFDVEVFEPATANKLMAALLVHDLRNPSAVRGETSGAAHGGLWRVAYQPRSCLGLAAVRGLALR